MILCQLPYFWNPDQAEARLQGSKMGLPKPIGSLYHGIIALPALIPDSTFYKDFLHSFRLKTRLREKKYCFSWMHLFSISSILFLSNLLNDNLGLILTLLQGITMGVWHRTGVFIEQPCVHRVPWASGSMGQSGECAFVYDTSWKTRFGTIQLWDICGLIGSQAPQGQGSRTWGM